MALKQAEHPVFIRFDRFVSAPVAGFSVNFVGQRTDPAFGHAGFDRDESSPDYPPAGEESFEWIAVLEAVLEARQTFTMFELGAGYGHWLVAAVCAARQKRPELRFKLVGVEPEPTHFGYLKKHFLDNDLKPSEHRLVEAAVNATGEPVPFIVGHPRDWYGQAIVPEGFVMRDYPSARTINLPAVKLVDLLEPHRYVDLIDMDIQGAEAEVVPSSIDAMTGKVRRAYVNTHSPEIHATVARAFVAAGWTLVAAHGWTGGEEETKFGRISYVDGIQYWLNPHVARAAGP